ncbi:hypothetical protein EYF80_056717 [Liparis tanakae]|uniref:Uncharacterized protein n=1 Tax=Liparis tanakae TaxID=230148 RepID=A0A4Z2EWE2_9TELE|nr:hypothetical protein EYF80_056717 [Liparis tanakae]
MDFRSAPSLPLRTPWPSRRSFRSIRSTSQRPVRSSPSSLSRPTSSWSSVSSARHLPRPSAVELASERRSASRPRHAEQSSRPRPSASTSVTTRWRRSPLAPVTATAFLRSCVRSRTLWPSESPDSDRWSSRVLTLWRSSRLATTLHSRLFTVSWAWRPPPPGPRLWLHMWAVAVSLASRSSVALPSRPRRRLCSVTVCPRTATSSSSLSTLKPWSSRRPSTMLRSCVTSLWAPSFRLTPVLVHLCSVFLSVPFSLFSSSRSRPLSRSSVTRPLPPPAPPAPPSSLSSRPFTTSHLLAAAATRTSRATLGHRVAAGLGAPLLAAGRVQLLLHGAQQLLQALEALTVLLLLAPQGGELVSSSSSCSSFSTSSSCSSSSCSSSSGLSVQLVAPSVHQVVVDAEQSLVMDLNMWPPDRAYEEEEEEEEEQEEEQEEEEQEEEEEEEEEEVRIRGAWRSQPLVDGVHGALQAAEVFAAASSPRRLETKEKDRRQIETNHVFHVRAQDGVQLLGALGEGVLLVCFRVLLHIHAVFLFPRERLMALHMHPLTVTAACLPAACLPAACLSAACLSAACLPAACLSAAAGVEAGLRDAGSPGAGVGVAGPLGPVVAILPGVTVATLPLHLRHHLVGHLVPRPPVGPVAGGREGGGVREEHLLNQRTPRPEASGDLWRSARWI